MRVVETSVEPAGHGLELACSESELGSGVRVDLALRNPTAAPIAVDRVRLQLDARPRLVLEHGWQSWSVVRRTTPADVLPARAAAPEWLRGQLHADPDFGGTVVSGDQFLVTDGGIAGFLDGRRNLSTVLAPARCPLEAVALLDGVEIAPHSERRLDPLWLADGDPGLLYSEYASLWGKEAGARSSVAPGLGWCSWYEYFTSVTPAHVRKNLALAREHGIGVILIDDGYAAGVGEWLEPAEAWKESPVADLAAEIAAAGGDPGIWTAPFLVMEGGSLAISYPDWLVGDARSDRPLRALHNPLWHGWCNTLDTTLPEVLDHLRSMYSRLREQGFAFQKIDFCYSAAMIGRRTSGNLTRAEALSAGLEAIREGVGEDTLLIASGCPLGPAVGTVDSMRVSDDVAPYWDPRGIFEGYPEATPAARNSVAASALRAPLHRRVFSNDPDCVLLRPTGTMLTRDERRTLTHAVLGTGGILLLSDDLGRYGPEEWGLVARMSALAADADGPLDLVDPFATPLEVDGPAFRLEIAWDAAHSRLLRRPDRANLLP